MYPMMTTETSPADLDDIQSEIGDLRRIVSQIDADLSNAESCETRSDVLANLDEAIGQAQTLLRALRAARKAAS